jgi:DNA-binding NarL/FixJ family response regulator
MTSSLGIRPAPAMPRQAGRKPQVPTLIAANLGFGVIQLDVTVVNVAINRIGAAFGGGTTQMQWVVSSYVLIFAALILTAGSLGDRFGARRMICAGFPIFLDTGESPLTSREADVLREAAAGTPTEQIGSRLALSPATVRNYLSSAISKVGGHNRIDAIRIARENGWL